MIIIPTKKEYFSNPNTDIKTKRKFVALRDVNKKERQFWPFAYAL